MALPTAYTEAELAAFIHAELGGVATALGWTVDGGSYDEAVNDALYLANVSDIASVSGSDAVFRLRRLAMLAAWRRVVAAVSLDYDFSADGGDYSRSQVAAQAAARVRELETETAGYRGDYAVEIQRVDHTHNPYQERAIEDRTL